jgi:hypothetical protein
MQESEYALQYFKRCLAGKAKIKRYCVLRYQDLNENGLKKFDRNPEGINLMDFKPMDLTPFGFILFHALDHFKILKDETDHD